MMTGWLPATFRMAVVIALAGIDARAELEWRPKDVPTVMDAGAETTGKSFTIKNTGGKAVRVQRVEADCPCITIVSKAERIGPGETGVIEVRFEAGGRVGAQRKRISVFTDDARDSAFSFTWDIKITEIVRIRPLFLHWSRNGNKDGKEALVDVVLDGAKVNGWRMENAAFLVEGEKGGGKSLKLRVSPVSTAEVSRERLMIDILMPDQTVRSYPLRLIVR